MLLGRYPPLQGVHGDNSPFDGPRKQLAHAFQPEDGRSHFDDAEQWVLGSGNSNTFNIMQVSLLRSLKSGEHVELWSLASVRVNMYDYVRAGIKIMYRLCIKLVSNSYSLMYTHSYR